MDDAVPDAVGVGACAPEFADEVDSSVVVVRFLILSSPSSFVDLALLPAVAMLTLVAVPLSFVTPRVGVGGKL